MPLSIPARSLLGYIDSQPNRTSSQTYRRNACPDWETLLLYAADMPVRDISIQPSLIVPAS